MSAPASFLNRHRVALAWAVTLSVLVVGIAPFAPYIFAAAGRSGGMHAPDWSRWLGAPLKIQIHSAAAIIALAIGIVIMLRPKGRALHKLLGWSWVIAMAVTAVSSLFITSITNGYSLLHLLSGWTVISLPVAIWAIRRGNVKGHRQAMTGMFVGGLIIAGSLTFLPGRLFWSMLFG